ncbi:uncharacterized protein [Venturia canescens]|uniref:uncharacterized protein isoform X2 n=1 Tax=Venturia canescens TaxID=32260 RepID=UPI001C9C7DAF|nr:uncharacterized protein LOC122416949 isoform X2 [Venturia canescens]
MARVSDRASFHQDTNEISDVSVVYRKPLAPRIRQASEGGSEHAPGNSEDGDEKFLNNEVPGFLKQPVEFSNDNHDGTREMETCEKPMAPSFESVAERGRNHSANGLRNDEESGANDRGDEGKKRGNNNGDLEECESQNDRAKYYYSEKKHFHGFVSNSEFPNLWRKPENINVYATKKTIAQGMLDVALLAANATQLKNLLVVGEAYQFYIFTLTLVCLSIALQVLVGILFIILGSLDINRRRDQRAAIIMNDIILIAIFLISLINIIIAGFNIDFSYKPTEFPEPAKNV